MNITVQKVWKAGKAVRDTNYMDNCYAHTMYNLLITDAAINNKVMFLKSIEKFCWFSLLPFPGHNKQKYDRPISISNGALQKYAAPYQQPMRMATPHVFGRLPFAALFCAE